MANNSYGQVPVINSFSPESGPVGTTVVITGSNFNASAINNTVYFGAEQGLVVSAGNTQLKVVAPAGASCEPITITANGLTGYSRRPFIVTFNVTPFNAGSLNKKVDFTSGGDVYGIAVKDLDGDGKPDIVSVNANAQSVSFFKNNSQPGIPLFTRVVTKSVNDNGYSVGVAVDDLDGDGKPDAVVANYAAGILSVFRNTSIVNQLSFDDARMFTTEPNPYDIVIADFNGDGKPDIAVTSNNSAPATISVFTNITTPGGPILFSPRQNLLTQGGPRGISAQDIDMDGKPDIIVTCQSGFISIFKNTSVNNNTRFASTMDYQMPLGSNAESSVITDMDGDGKPDVVVANNDSPGSISVLKNNSTPGAISFLPIQSFVAGGYPFSISSGDINGDGKPDIAVTNQLDNLVTVLINTSSQSNISFGAKASFGTDEQPRSVIVGDLDGDGKPDLTVGDVASGFVSVLLAIPPPSIQTGPKTGSIVTCAGTASADPAILQFTVSGTNLKGDIVASAPAGFEVSTSAGNGFSNGLTLHPINGTIVSTFLYVRASATAAGGTNTGNVVLSTPGIDSKNVIVNEIVNAVPVVNLVSDQVFFNGATTNPVHFTGTANRVTWTNDQPGIGLPATGTGDIGQFTAINNSNGPITATITATPSSNIAAGGTGCSGVPHSFKITVNPSPAITITDNLTAVNTIYGTSSSSSNFKVSATNLSIGITITPPTGFELSINNVNFSSTVTIGTTGNINAIPVYIRLASVTAAGNYSGDISITSAGANAVNILMPASEVSPAPLTIKATDVSKTYGSGLTNNSNSTDFTVTAGALQNGNTVTSVSLTYGAGAESTANTGTYATISPVFNTGANGFLHSNYDIAYVPGNITVTPAPLTIAADNKNKTFGTVNPELTASYSGFVNNENTSKLTTQPFIFTTAITTSPAGQYPITVSDATSPNYAITFVPGLLTILSLPTSITIPNTFTPNGDGINDLWTIPGLASYDKSKVFVYNRWGSLIYHSIGYAKPWDGTTNGKKLPSGTYYYLINLANNTASLSGYITIIR